MWFAVLGPLSISLDGGPVSLGGRKQRTLLAIFLLHANDVVARDQLIDALWGGEPPPSAAESLDTYVYRLRRLLEHDRLPRTAGGYLLRVEPGEFDVDRFERLVAGAGRAAEAGEHTAVVGALTQALALWRGLAWAELSDHPSAVVEAQRLESLRLLAFEQRIDAELALGRHAVLCPELESLVAEHPLRERMRGQLMLALYRSGRQADALEVYRAGRSLLVEELGLEPAPTLKQLERAILEQDAALEVPPAAPRRPSEMLAEAPATELVSADIPGREKAPPLRSRYQRRWAALAVAVGIALVTFAIAQDRAGSAQRPMINANAIALISPAGDRVVSAVRLTAAPTDVATGFGSVWVSEAGQGHVVRRGAVVLPWRCRSEPLAQGGRKLRRRRRTDHHRVSSAHTAMSITIANITFDNVDYDAGADVLYLHRGDPRTAVDFDESPEGHALRYDASGQLVGITIVNARWLLEQDGKIEITLPPQHVDVVAAQLDDALAAA